MTKQEEIIDLFQKNELILARLYTVYAQKFPEHFGFWNVLVKDEEFHAKILGDLFLKIKDGVIFFDDDRFKIGNLAAFYESVKKELDQAQNPKVDIITALSAAVYFEEALIEKDYFIIFESDVVEFKNTLRTLKEGSIMHLEYVRNKWKEERALLGIS